MRTNSSLFLSSIILIYSFVYLEIYNSCLIATPYTVSNGVLVPETKFIRLSILDSIIEIVLSRSNSSVNSGVGFYVRLFRGINRAIQGVLLYLYSLAYSPKQPHTKLDL